VSIARHPLMLWAFALALAAGFASLGAWQLGRSGDKQRMLDAATQTLQMRRAQPPAALTDAARAGSYDWVALAGRFADTPAVLLDNQQKQGRVGVRVYRAFLPESGPAVLIDLGWLPLPPDRRMPRLEPERERRRIEGLLMPPPGKGIGMGAPAPLADGSLLTTTVDLPTLATALGLPALAPRVLRPEAEAGFGYARDFDILPNTLPPERHLGYAVQWFALSAAVLVTAALLTLRSVRKRRGTLVP
jgi:surfeit locus 1 family protein